MATRKQLVPPLLDFESVEFAEQYERGMWWSMYGERQNKGLVPTSYLVSNLKAYAQQGHFTKPDPFYRHHLGFYIGMYHGGVLDPATKQPYADVTTLAHLDHPDAERGYRAGREFFFVDAEPHEQRLSESYLIERIQQDVIEMVHWRNGDATWFFAVGCLLGELSGSLFPMDEDEQQVYLPASYQMQQARRQYKAASQVSLPVQTVLLS